MKIKMTAANERRARNAKIALDTYGLEDGYGERLRDLLTDLRHWSDANSEDFYAALDMSYQHYLCERAGRL